MSALTQQRLLDLVTYEPETGEFYARVDRARIRAGARIPGCPDDKGYLRIGIDNRSYKSHHLAWLYVHGRWPVGEVDHRDGNTGNNAIQNLRECSAAQNHQNLKRFKNNSSGFTGVNWKRSHQRWEARILARGKHHHLGYFDTPEAAYTAYLSAKARLHEFQPVPRYENAPHTAFTGGAYVG